VLADTSHRSSESWTHTLRRESRSGVGPSDATKIPRRVVMQHSGNPLGANPAGMSGRIHYFHQSKLERPPHASADKARLPETGLREHAC
jgi:hypothetical protein